MKSAPITPLALLTLACSSAPTPPDAGQRPADAGSAAPLDASLPPDASDEADAGQTLDSGALPDASSPVDAGPQTLEGSWQFDGDTVSVRATAQGVLRSYTLSSTHTQRDQAPSERTINEREGDPILRSGVLLTDALFAMAVEEARQNAVEQISDDAFNGVIDCSCYQTGALWNWVWTRDIAYAVELGLAWIDPQRAANSLLFKLSRPKAGGGLQIVQDTGTGGSWPVSTDRVTWARGTMAVLRQIDHPELRAAAVEAMRNSAEWDRRYAYDARDGLYFGETSFLDWREQTYAAYTAGNVVEIAMSKSLNTNLNHLFLLRSLEELTGEAHGSQALAERIDAVFYDGATYRSFTGNPLNPAPVEQQDLLATSLAVLDLGTHPEALTAYPFGAHGPPVIWPQQQQVPIYHNRAIWPFVTAYSVLAARRAGQGEIFSAGLNSLVRGAALNLSNMENLEVASGANWVEDGPFSGPVINSQRQLWSVAGFIGAVVEGVFGLRTENGVRTAAPILPAGEWFREGAVLTLGGFEARIGDGRLPAGTITQIASEDWRDLFGARAPSVTLEGAGDSVTLRFEGEEGATFTIYKDGIQVAQNATSPWRDRAATTGCYSVVARLRLPSLPSQPQCWWGDGYTRIQSVYAQDFTSVGGVWSTEHGRGHYSLWGAPEHTLTMRMVPNHTGEHFLQLVYGNGAGSIETGVTAGVKLITVRDERNAVIAEGAVVMPHRSGWSDWGDSSLVPATLEAGRAYTVEVSDGVNMSYLDHYRVYRGGRGGGDRPSNDVNIAELKVLFMR